MRKVLTLAAGLTAVTLAAAVTVPANAVISGTTAPEAGPNVLVSTPTGECSGTLINLWMVLTAWHCFKDGTTGTIRWGSTNRSKGKKVAISTVVHEDDLAVVYLAEDIPFGEVEYPPLGTVEPQVGDTVQFFGFGADDSGHLSSELRTGSATVIHPVFSALEEGPCWSTRAGGSGHIAPGDSGGGAYLDGKLVGVASSGNPSLANFASIPAHMTFLNQQLQ